MADKKIVTLEQLARNNTKVKEKLDEKISKKGDQTLDGSLITTGNISIQGNLNVQGSTQTVNQETLTIKDNIIAVNGDATSLETVGMIGIIAITGEDSLYLKDGTYYIDKQALLAAIGGKELAQKYSTFALLHLSKFNTLSLHPRFDEAYNVHLTISGEETLHLFWRDNDTLNPMSDEALFTFDYDNNNGEVTLVGNSKSRALYFKDQAIKSLEHKELIKSFLLDSTGNFVTEENFAKKGQAYATPVYNHNQGDDVNKYKTLRIGAGSYQKDDNGNVVSFTFDMDEDQAIATRADDIEDGSLVAWDDTQKKLVKSNCYSHANKSFTIGNNKDTQGSKSSIQVGYGNNSVGMGADVLGGENTVGFSYIDIALDGTFSLNGVIYDINSLTITNNEITIDGIVYTVIKNVEKDGKEVPSGLYYKTEDSASKNIWAFADGEGNVVSGRNSTALGYKNSVSHRAATAIGRYLKTGRDYQLVVGKSNEGLSDTLFEIGNGTTSTGNRRNIFQVDEDGNVKAKGRLHTDTKLSVGIQNISEASYTINVGVENKTKSTASANIGSYNSTSEDATNVIVSGCANKATKSYTSTFGYKLINNSVTSLVIGEYNEGKSDTLFEAGKGTSEKRENAFEILKDGRAKVYGAPQESNDVIRKEDLLNLTYPIGSIYMSVNSTSPTTLFGGTWERLKDKFLLGASDTYSAGATGGAAEVTLNKQHIPSHSHNINHTHTDGQHAHLILLGSENVAGTGGQTVYSDTANPENGHKWVATTVNESGYTGDHTHSYTGNSGTYGGNQAHNNMPPYLAVYMWKRVS